MPVRDPFLTPELLAHLDSLPLAHRAGSAEARDAIAAARRENPRLAAVYELATNEKAARDAYLALKASAAPGTSRPPDDALAAAFARWEDAWRRFTTARADQENSDHV